jgi:lysophospholipase L1-like esterase
MKRATARLMGLVLCLGVLAGPAAAQPGVAPPETPVEGPAALARFFAALAAREASPARGRVRVTQVGDSHVAADLWSGRLRALIQTRFGDGGRGFVLAGRPWRGSGQNHVRTDMAGPWRVDLKAEGFDDGRLGPSTCGVASADPEATVTVGTASKGELGRAFSLLDVFFVRQANGGCFEVRADDAGEGVLLGRVGTRGPWPEPDVRRFELSDGPHLVSVRPLASGPDREVRLIGFSLERPEGALWDALGVNGAQARALLKQDPDALSRVLERFASDLLVVSYGTNELYDRHLSLEAYTAQLVAVLRTLRAAAPRADCLVTGPFDLLKGRRAPALTDAVVDVQRAQAAAHGCAFFDARAAMGGPGSIRTWKRQALAQRDGVHLTRGGYERIAELMFAALMQAYEGWRSGSAAVPGPSVP